MIHLVYRRFNAVFAKVLNGRVEKRGILLAVLLDVAASQELSSTVNNLSSKD
jgi:hypothetical protein